MKKLDLFFVFWFIFFFLHLFVFIIFIPVLFLTEVNALSKQTEHVEHWTQKIKKVNAQTKKSEEYPERRRKRRPLE